MLNLDTHMVVYAFMGTVTARERRFLTGDSWSISSIVLWELAKLEQLGRLEIALDSADVVRALSAFTCGRSIWRWPGHPLAWTFERILPAS